MSKKTNINVSKDKMFTDLHRLLETQNFKSEDELKNFLNNMMGAEIPSFPKEALSIKEQAQDLIFEAHESSITEGRKKAAEALKLDPDCIEAYEYLGTLENDVTKAMLHFQKGVDIGKRLFGGEFREENKGAFWMIHETRPYMRCQQHLADCFYGLGKIEESVALLEELIELNPNDNQGARDQLLLFLIVMGEFGKFEKYAKQFDDDDAAFPLFNKALFAFIIEGESENALKKLKEAMKSNKFVVKKLLSAKFELNIPETIAFGQESEADYYVTFARHVWDNIKGAKQWLRKNDQSK